MGKQNWRNASDYSRGLSPHGWAWEFLRRNPDYRADWLHFAAIEEKWGTADNEAPAVCPNLDAWECDSPAQPGETQAAWIKRTGGGSKTTLRAAITRRWGLLVLPFDPQIPATDTTDLLFDLSVLRVDIVGAGRWLHRLSELMLDRAQIALCFDLAQPIATQMARAGKYLRETQTWLNKDKGIAVRKDAPKYPLHKLVEYLRILDAREAGAGAEDIARVLYSSLKNSYPERTRSARLNKSEKEAVDLRNRAYRDLALMRHRAKRPRKITRA